ncbi:MAG: CHASE domain-containing protein [Magnetospirillum sp. WYHS-4]
MGEDVKARFLQVLHNPATAWVILVCSLILTAAAWHISNRFVQERARDRFQFQAQDIKAGIARRMLEYEAVLRSGVGLFAASETVERAEWGAFVETAAIDRYFPGIQGIGYSRIVPPDAKAAHIEAVRAEGFPNYTIRPDGEREVYTAIVYLEPFAGRNLRAFGYDMFSEPVRRTAMERARDTGQAAMSGMVTLVQETDQDVQRGLLVYLPVYRAGMPAGTVEERQAALEGFVYAPFRIKDLMRGILGAGMTDLHFELYDGTTPSAETLLYDSDPGGHRDFGDPEQRPEFTQTSAIQHAGHAWTLHLYTQKGFVTAAEASQPLVVAMGGVLIDLLLFVIIASIARQQQRAEALALRMTAELRHSREELADKAEALARSNVDLRQFAYVASHDLQTPLRTVTNYLQLLDKRYKDKLDDNAHEYIGFAVEGAKRMSALIRDLLEYSCIDGKGGDMNPVCLDDVTRQALDNLQTDIQEVGARVEAAPLPLVVGDDIQLVRLIQNLVGNALKYRHPDRSPVVRLDSRREGNKWVISIADNGIGIAPEYFERIFLIFQRLHTADEYEGTGIGLAVCRRIVERHGGRIWVDSLAGEGSTFRFTLPAG